MIKKIFFFLLFFALHVDALTFINEGMEQCNSVGSYARFSALEINLLVHVVTMLQEKITNRLILAPGQREEVSSLAQRSGALIAVNGGNYRRGGKYNGNRVNLVCVGGEVVSDVGLERGSLGYNGARSEAVIDSVVISKTLCINGMDFVVDQINQPRGAGSAVMYTSGSDVALCNHNPGMNILIDGNCMVVEITKKTPDVIPEGWCLYQTDDQNTRGIAVGMIAEYSVTLESSKMDRPYEEYDSEC